MQFRGYLIFLCLFPQVKKGERRKRQAILPCVFLGLGIRSSLYLQGSLSGTAWLQDCRSLQEKCYMIHLYRQQGGLIPAEVRSSAAIYCLYEITVSLRLRWEVVFPCLLNEEARCFNPIPSVFLNRTYCLSATKYFNGVYWYLNKSQSKGNPHNYEQMVFDEFEHHFSTRLKNRTKWLIIGSLRLSGMHPLKQFLSHSLSFSLCIKERLFGFALACC